MSNLQTHKIQYDPITFFQIGLSHWIDLSDRIELLLSLYPIRIGLDNGFKNFQYNMAT